MVDMQQELRRWTPAAWLFVRLILGIEWLRGGWEKIGDPGWTASPTGRAVEGFLQGAVAKSTEGPHPEVPHWWHELIDDVFLPNSDVLAYLVAYGELLVGIALIAGVLTRPAALAGVLMNLAFLWSGTSSSNPSFVVLGLAVVLVGSHAGEYGVDRWLAPWLQERAGRSGRAIAFLSLAILGSTAVGWLSWVMVDTWVWVLALATGIAAVFVARRAQVFADGRPAGPRG